MQSADEKAIVSVANLLGDFPWGLEHLIVESLEVFAWMIDGKAEGLPYRHCHREEDHIKCSVWLSSRVSPANFHEGMIGQTTKRFTNDYWMHEKDMPADMKSPCDSSRMEDISQKFPKTVNACQFLFTQYRTWENSEGQF